MTNHLVTLAQEALKLQKMGDLREAIKLYEMIIKENPNYEFGICFYSIAYCQKELGEIEKARENYLKVLEYDDEDDIRLGGFASFLYQYGNPKEALEAHLKLLKFENKWRFDSSKTLIAINALAKKIGLSDQEVEKLIKNL
ncbi:MAG: tetratricopeptide repeat protein [Gammaproteobacteria bacterium]